MQQQMHSGTGTGKCNPRIYLLMAPPSHACRAFTGYAGDWWAKEFDGQPLPPVVLAATEPAFGVHLRMWRLEDAAKRVVRQVSGGVG